MEALLEEKKKKKRLFLLEDEQTELMDKTLSYFDSLHFGMSDFQIKNFVVNKVDFPTPFSRWRQAKMELWSRYCGVIESHFSYRETQAKLEIAEEKLIRLQNDEVLSEDKIRQGKIKLLEIKIERFMFQIQVSHKMVREKLNEMQSFFDVVLAEEPDVSDDEREEERKFWMEKMKQQPMVFKQRYDIGVEDDAG